MEQYESSGSLTAIRVYNYDRGNTNDKTNPEDGFMTDETMKVFERIPHGSPLTQSLTCLSL